MKIDNFKLDLVLARQCKSYSDLRNGVSPATLQRILSGGEVKPATLGRIAMTLGIDPAELLEEGKP